MAGRRTDTGGRPGALSAIEPVGFEQHNGLLGSAGRETGRGDSASDAGANPLGDESFVKAWGALPDDRLTLAGTTRLDFKKLPTLRTGPAAPQGQDQADDPPQDRPGTDRLPLRGRNGELSGSLDHLSSGTPRGLTILSVESDGLTRLVAGRGPGLLLRYDRPLAASKRS